MVTVVGRRQEFWIDIASGMRGPNDSGRRLQTYATGGKTHESASSQVMIGRGGLTALGDSNGPASRVLDRYRLRHAKAKRQRAQVANLRYRRGKTHESANSQVMTGHGGLTALGDSSGPASRVLDRYRFRHARAKRQRAQVANLRYRGGTGWTRCLHGDDDLRVA